MNKVVIHIILFLLFLLEGTVFQLLTLDYFGSAYSIVPRFVLAIIILYSINHNRKKAMYTGLIFGLLYDIIYGNPLGLYMAGMAAAGYFSGWIMQYFHQSFSLFFFIELIGISLFEIYVYGMLRLFHLVNIPIQWAIEHVLLPSIIVNILFAMIVYKPMKRWLEETEEEDEGLE